MARLKSESWSERLLLTSYPDDQQQGTQRTTCDDPAGRISFLIFQSAPPSLAAAGSASSLSVAVVASTLVDGVSAAVDVLPSKLLTVEVSRTSSIACHRGQSLGL